MKRMIFGLGLLSMLGSWQPARADQLFVRNRPFKGYASNINGSLAGIRVDVAALAEAMGYKLTSVGDNWVLHKPTECADLHNEQDHQKLFVHGVRLDLQTESGVQTVGLQEVSAALGARFRRNASMGTVDFDLPTAVAAEAPAASPGGKKAPAASESFSAFQVINFGAPW